ncbi:MAG: hypothetical protein RJA81_381 [Planctomycetota bacterium]
MAKKSASIEKMLSDVQTDDSHEELKTRLQPIFESFQGELREFGFHLFHFDNDEEDDDDSEESDTPDRISREQKRKKRLSLFEAFEKASESQRKKVFAALAPKLSDEIELAWQLLKQMPYQAGYLRRSFRAPNHPDASLESRVDWFHSISSELCEIQRDCITAPWLARWSQHAFQYSSDCVVPVLIAVMNQANPNSEEVFEILYQTVTGEESIGIMADHVIASLLGSNRSDGWEIIEKTLMAAQRQEGLRQSILTNADCAHP